MTRSRQWDWAAEGQAAAAQTAFVRAAWSALSSKARRQLFSRRTETELGWATRWGVNAPCMLAYARYLRDLQANSSDEPLGRKLRRGLMRVDHGSSVPPPPEVLAEIQRLDRLPDTGLSLSEKVAPNAIDEYRRHKLADDEAFLARPGLQYWETDKHYAERVPDYCLARRLRFPRFLDSATSSTPSSRLHEHVQWLVEFQVRGKDEAVIARSSGFFGTAGTKKVRRAIHVLAQLIGLVLRRKPSGRPRVTPPATLQEARLLRATLTRRFQEARNKSRSGLTSPLYEAEIRITIDEQFSSWTLQQQKELFHQIKSGHHMKPSDAAARLSACKFALSLRLVRRGRVSNVRRQHTGLRFQPFTAETEQTIAKEQMMATLRRRHHRSR